MNRSLIIALVAGIVIAVVIGLMLSMRAGNDNYPDRPGVGTNPDAMRVAPDQPPPANALPAAPAVPANGG